MFKSGIIFYIFAFLIIVNQSSAQGNLREIKSNATEYFRVEEYPQALPLYLKLDSLNPENAETNYRIGVCYYNSEYKLKALPYFSKAKKLLHKHHEMDLMLGRIYHLDHQFDKAIESYNHHRKYVNDKSNGLQADNKEIDRLIAQCELAKKLMANPLNYEITNLGPKINSKYSDYAPVISADETEMIFTSKRNTTTGGGFDDLHNGYYEDVYISNKEGKEWGEAKGIGPVINTNGHDAAIGLSPDGQELFLYKPQPNNKFLAGDIYVSDLDGANWKKPVKLSENINSPYWESHASITADERTLYFTSDKPGGKGHKDIYVSRRMPDGNWGVAEDLSDKVNTEFDEDCPFIHPDGKTLYFSSIGHASMGGYDIFKTVYNEDTKQWSEPENVGYPINTADDDLFLVWSADGTRAYFSSIRADTYGEKDIYMASKKEVSNFVVVLKGKVTDKKTGKPIAAVLNIFNLSKGEIVGVINSNSSTGKYVLVLPVGKDFSVTAEAEGYVFHSEHINVQEADKFMEIEQNLDLEPVGEIDKVAVLNNVFFDYDKSTLRPQSKTELDRLVKLLKSKSDAYVEIAAHTDSIANNIYNMKLSKNRAKAVVNYLIANGIDSTRLLPVGYGEDFPIARNTTPEDRQLNRRSEFIFVDKFQFKTRYENTFNAFYFRKERDSLERERKISEEKFLKLTDPVSSKLITVKDNKYKMRIYFPGKKTELTDSLNKDLLDFVQLLKENKSPILIEGHAESNSKEGAELIRKRTAVMVKYLTKHGFGLNNITTKFVEDKKLLNAQESSKLHRRIEISINVRHLED
ncbi:MAG: OmpA family protein [Opitutaceae bacterium]|nr:OmpA family protein [Cytophagales bacterium]